MRQHVAKLGLAILVGGGGCSLLYNPSNIKGASDAKEFHDVPPPDMEMIVDANPMNVMIDTTMLPPYPAAIDEGVGLFNSHPAIVAVHGDNFIATATVSFTPATAVTLVEMKVSSDHKYIVLALQAPIDSGCVPPMTIPVRLQVDEPDGAGGTATTHLDNAFAVTCLRELTTVASPLSSSTLDPKYSKIEITGGITLKADTTETPSAILRSASHIMISGAIVASAMGQSSGPGGGRGGDADASGSGPGDGGAGTSNGLGNGGGGGGAGFAAAGGAGSGDTGGMGAGGGSAGDVFISSYASAMNRASGGGGGGDGSTGTTGAGGGGGGTVELTAAGDVMVSDITANGGNSTAGTVGIVTKGGDGGAGAGGLVLVRTGATLTLGTVSVAAGTPPSGGNGGTASAGRVRVDSAKGVQAPSGGYIGPMFIDAPATTTTYPELQLRGKPNELTSLVEVIDRDGNVVDNGHLYMPAFGSPAGTGTVGPVLKVGYNRVCVFVTNNTDPSIAEGTNCVEIGYAP
jgi:hypothetical protein